MFVFFIVWIYIYIYIYKRYILICVYYYYYYQCQLVNSDWNDEFRIHLDDEKRVYHVDYYAEGDTCESNIEVRQKKKKKDFFYCNKLNNLYIFILASL